MHDHNRVAKASSAIVSLLLLPGKVFAHHDDGGSLLSSTTNSYTRAQRAKPIGWRELQAQLHVVEASRCSWQKLTPG